jgi:toxin ParE1/3/4
MSKIVKRPQAEEDLFDVWLYIARDSVKSADRFVAQFDQKFTLPAKTPEMGRLRLDISFFGIRSFPVSNYVIFYLPIKNGIEIVRILHGNRDVPNLL